MNLLCVVPSYWPAVQFGGPIFAIHNLNKALAEIGYDITVYSTNIGLEQKIVPDKEKLVEEIKVTYFSYSRIFEPGSSSGWQFSRPLTRALKRNIPLFDLIYIVSVWNYPSAIAAHYCRLHNKPYIITPRGHLYPETMNAKRWKKSIYYNLIMKRYMKGSTAIHYTSEDEANECHKRLQFNNQAIVVPNGIEFEKFDFIADKNPLLLKFPHLKDKKIILFLGRISWKKGFDILIPAYASLRASHPDTHLIIAGNDLEGYKKDVKRLIQRQGLKYSDPSETGNTFTGADITFVGHLDEQEKLETWSGSDLFVLPSYSENFGNTVLEAMACGLPVIVSNKVALSSEVSASRAGAVIGLDSGELAAAIAHLLDHPEMARESGERGKRLVREKFTWQQVARNMANAFEQILPAHRPPAIL